MKLSLFACLAAALIFVSCAAPRQDAPAPQPTWKNNPRIVQTPAEITEEIAEKIGRVTKFLAEEKLDAIVLTEVRNVNWITAGLVNTQIVLNKDAGAASLVITKDGRKFLLCNGSEGPRLMDESTGALGYQLVQYDWYAANPVRDDRGAKLASIVGKGKVGCDVAFPGAAVVDGKFARLRYSLTAGDLKRYRWLGHESTEAVCAVCRAVKPGMDEFEIEALTAAEVRSRGIMPTVILTAVDERISKYRHALPGGAKLQKYAMINIIGEKWGMPVAVTRFVHFGPLSDDLSARLQKTAMVNAQYEAATVPGTKCADIFEKVKQWYAQAGFDGEWQKHHQGGAIGYNDREYIIYPGVQETVQDSQAFAWNPTITGAKIEDTMIAFKDHIEVITTSADWPMIPVLLDGKSYPQPGILVR